MGRIGRSFELVGQSWAILRQDKELVVLPLISGVLMVIVAASFFFSFDVGTSIDAKNDAAVMLPVFLFYVAAYAIGIFFQAAVIAGATERLRGGDPTVKSALSAAAQRIVPILLWAVAAATVGMILRSIQERAGFVGKIVVSFLGAAWSLATFFVVPVLVLEEGGVSDAVSRSIDIFKRTWGETLAGGVTISLAALCSWVTLVGVVMLLFAAHLAAVAIVVGAVGVLALATIFPALDGIFVAALYRYATAGAGQSGTDVDGVAKTFAPTGRSSIFGR